MRDFLVLNLVTNDIFSLVLKEISDKLKFTVKFNYQNDAHYNLIFTDLEHLNSFAINEHFNVVGVIKSPLEIVDFYDKDINITIPIDIIPYSLEKLLNKQITLKSFEMLKSTFESHNYYAFNDFIYYADSLFMHSNMGLAFLTAKLSFLLYNPNFDFFFQNIFYNPPVIGKAINSKFSKKDNLLWDEIIEKGNSFTGISLELDGKWKDASKHYNMYIKPIFKIKQLIGYVVMIEDISKFVNANSDLKRYYKYLLDQNTRLEKAYKEVELNNEKLKIAYEKVNALSNRDYLTQAPNRKFFLEKIEYEQLRFKRTKNPFILAYGDIDDFKFINDNFGHETGDYVLITLTNIIKNAIRSIDFFCRWGGEEFLIFLAESDMVLGKQIVERIINDIRNFDFNYNGQIIKITMTFGLAVYDKDQHVNQIIDIADQRLYWGKSHNKDQVVIEVPAE